MTDSQQNNGNGDNKTKIKILQRDVEAMEGILNKLDSAITNLNDLTYEVKKMVAVHEKMIEGNSKELEELKEALHARMDNFERMVRNDQSEHNKRISNLENWRFYIIGACVTLFLIAGFIAQVFSVGV